MNTRPLNIFLASLAVCGSVNSVSAGLPRSTAEAQGVSSAAILQFVEAADEKLDSLHSVMVVRHGHVIAEGWWTPYRADARHSLYSLSKSFTATAVGMAIAEGKLSLDDPVVKFFPDDVPASASNNLKAMRVHDLLRMSTGQQTEPARPMDQSWTKSFLEHQVPFKPGTHFLYNTSATYMASAIVQQATGEKLVDYLQSRLFQPLGIQNPTWEESPQGVSTGGYGLSVRTEDIASFGQLYLQKGKWQGKQLVPEAWVDAATARQTSNGSNPGSDWDQGYGYQFWRSRHGAYRGDGAFGQFCIVLPEQDAVIAITSGLKDMQAVLNLVWDKLLPAFQSGVAPENEADAKRLQQKLKSLTLRTPRGQGVVPDRLGRTFVFAENDRKLESMQLKPGSDDKMTANLSIRLDGAEHEVALGRDCWLQGRINWGKLPEQPVSASAAWTGDQVLTAKLCFHETPFVITLRLQFNDKDVKLTSESNVGFGATAEPPLTGQIAE